MRITHLPAFILVTTTAIPTGYVTNCILLLILISKQGDGTPADAHPSTLLKDGKKRTNTCQNVPRQSNELKENSEQYLILIEVFQPVFNWLNAQVCN